MRVVVFQSVTPENKVAVMNDCPQQNRKVWQELVSYLSAVAQHNAGPQACPT